MVNARMRNPRALSLSPDSNLAVPSKNVTNSAHGRSLSTAPSYRSTQSHITTVEDKDDNEREDRPGSRRRSMQRQQTYKIGRGLGFFDRVKGVLLPNTLFAKIEDSIEVITSDIPDDEMFHRQGSPWIVDVHVSPKGNSMAYHQTLCLLDTGCSHGNIVSKELVDSLGFTKEDYQELSELERQGGVTLAGEPFPIEAAIFLSWHHNTSLKRFRQMRFLVSSHAKNFDMIIGAQTIIKYSLLSRPIFGAVNLGSVKIPPNDNFQNRLTNERSYLESSIENYEDEQKEEKDVQAQAALGTKIVELKHLLELKEVELERERAQEADKSMCSTNLDKLTEAWDKAHPKRPTELLKITYPEAYKDAEHTPATVDISRGAKVVPKGANASSASSSKVKKVVEVFWNRKS